MNLGSSLSGLTNIKILYVNNAASVYYARNVVPTMTMTLYTVCVIYVITCANTKLSGDYPAAISRKSTFENQTYNILGN